MWYEQRQKKELIIENIIQHNTHTAANKHLVYSKNKEMTVETAVEHRVEFCCRVSYDRTEASDYVSFYDGVSSSDYGVEWWDTWCVMP